MSAQASRMQLRMDFEPQITEQFRTLKRCVAAVVYGSKIGLDGCAAACDVSPSTLSRMLNDKNDGKRGDKDQKRNLPLDFLVIIMEVTKDYRPLLWLGAKFLPNDDQRKDAALARVELMLPSLLEALGTLKGSGRR